MHTLPSTTPTIVKIKHGEEGPHYDPYGYTEIEINRNNHRAVIHTGLLDSVTIDGTSSSITKPGDIEAINEALLNTIGMDYNTAQDLEHYLMNKPIRCACGKPTLASSPGFAGESITYCKKCGEVLDEGDPTPYIM